MNPFKPKRLAILCGIANYGKPFGNLPAVAADVSRLAETLQTKLQEDFRFEEVRVYLDEQVTLTCLVRILDELKNKSPIDELLFYLAGHGCLRGNHYYYATYGAEMVRPGMRLDELAEGLQAVYPQKTLAVLDFCHAGVLPENLSPINHISLEGTERLTVLAAARAGELATAGGTDRRPSFTQHFIDALQKAQPDSEGIIRWGNVEMYVCAAMERDLNQRPIDLSQLIRTHPVNRVAGHGAVDPGRKAVQPERRQGTVGIIEISNYPTLSQHLDVEDLDQVLRGYTRVCRDVISELEGSIVNQKSDELLVYFGYPQSHEDDAIRDSAQRTENSERDCAA